MNDLLSQLWVCLTIAVLLGTVLGWFLRGDRGNKLAEIENRWHKRFSDLEYTHQSLIKKLKDCIKQERSHKALVSRLGRMKRGAELSGNELKQKKIRIVELESNLDKLVASSKDTLFATRLLPNTGTVSRQDTLSETVTKNSKIQENQQLIKELESKYALLTEKVDEYRVSLLDAESKLQVAYEMLETQGWQAKRE